MKYSRLGICLFNRGHADFLRGQIGRAHPLEMRGLTVPLCAGTTASRHSEGTKITRKREPEIQSTHIAEKAQAGRFFTETTRTWERKLADSGGLIQASGRSRRITSARPHSTSARWRFAIADR
jgi:hypothetical protein